MSRPASVADVEERVRTALHVHAQTVRDEAVDFELPTAASVGRRVGTRGRWQVAVAASAAVVATLVFVAVQRSTPDQLTAGDATGDSQPAALGSSPTTPPNLGTAWENVEYFHPTRGSLKVTRLGDGYRIPEAAETSDAEVQGRHATFITYRHARRESGLIIDYSDGQAGIFAADLSRAELLEVARGLVREVDRFRLTFVPEGFVLEYEGPVEG